MTVALYTGLFASAIHFIWSLMVAFGVGQSYLDWILGLHFIQNPFIIMPFNLGAMIALLIFTFVVGYILGWVGTVCWNKLAKK